MFKLQNVPLIHKKHTLCAELPSLPVITCSMTMSFCKKYYGHNSYYRCNNNLNFYDLQSGITHGLTKYNFLIRLQNFSYSKFVQLNGNQHLLLC